MTQEVPEGLRNLVVQFVKCYSDTVDLELDPNVDPKLWFMPLTSAQAKREAAHYFLLAAALSDNGLTGNPRNIRLLLNHLHYIFGNRLYSVTAPKEFELYIHGFETKTEFFDKLGVDKAEIPEVLTSVNRFVAQKAGGNLIQYAASMSKKGLKPKDLAKQLTFGIKRMNKQHTSKTWLYLRWMVRWAPDLGLFDFNPKDLMIPLTTPKLRVYVALDLSENEDFPFELNTKNRPESWWENTAEFDRDTERFTAFARSLFPDDPAVVDFPFFILGTWLEYSDLTPASIEKSMRFFIKKRQESAQPLMRYLTVIYHYNRIGQLIQPGAFGGLESDVYEFLKGKQTVFNYEFMEFLLPFQDAAGKASALTYKPDFLLPRLTSQGRKVLLEPHGVRSNLNEFLFKLSLFRRHYGEFFFLILVVPDDFVGAIRMLDPDGLAYDSLWRQSEYKIQFEKFKSS